MTKEGGIIVSEATSGIQSLPFLKFTPQFFSERKVNMTCLTSGDEYYFLAGTQTFK